MGKLCFCVVVMALPWCNGVSGGAPASRHLGFVVLLEGRGTVQKGVQRARMRVDAGGECAAVAFRCCAVLLVRSLGW